MKKLLAITLTLAMMLTLMSVATFTVSAEQTLIYRFTFENGGDTIMMKAGENVGQIVEWPVGSGNHALKYELNDSTYTGLGVGPYIWPNGINEILLAQGDLLEGESYDLIVDFAFEKNSGRWSPSPFMLCNGGFDNENHFTKSALSLSNNFQTLVFTLNSFDEGAPQQGEMSGGIAFLGYPDKYIYIDNVTLVKNGAWKPVLSDIGIAYRDGTPAEEGIVKAVSSESSGEETSAEIPVVPNIDDFRYEIINGSSVKITRYVGQGGNVPIPSSIASKPVTAIGDGAFTACAGLTSVIIPSTVTSIGKQAFYDCTSLQNISVPDKVTRIESQTFVNCSSLTNVVIPEGVNTIGDSAFAYCSSLNKVSISDNVTTIGVYAFVGCTALTSISLPHHLTVLAGQVFQGCTALKTVVLPRSVSRVSEGAFENCYNLETVFYAGTQSNRDYIEVADRNGFLLGAKWIYESDGPSEEPSEEPSGEPSNVSDLPGGTGDANGDGSTDMKDVLFSRKFIAGMNVTVNQDALDVNRDGSVDMKDVLLMRKFIAGLIDHLG